MRTHDHDQPPAAGLVNRARPEQAIAEAAAACSNWGRWGDDDVRGTLNFLTDDKRVEGARLVRRGVSFSLAQPFDASGPQTGWRRRTNPVHTMLDTGLDAARGVQGFPHGFGGADDVVFMPLQCSTQWDGLGHIFDHGRAWNGRAAADVVTSEGDRITGIETAAGLIAGRAVLLDAGRALGRDGELADGFAITPAHLETVIAAQGETARVGRGDIVLVRTGQLARVRRDGWGGYAGGPAPGLSFTCATWLRRTEIAAIATDTWGFEVRPNEFDGAFQPLHQVVIPHIGLYIGEMWDLEALAADCAADGRYEFWITAAPIPVTGAVGSPVNPIAVKLLRSESMPNVRNVLIVGGGAAGCAAAILFARDGAAVDLVEVKPDLSALGSGITVQGNALRVLRQLGVWDEVAAAGYAFNTVGLRAPDGTLLVEMQDARTGGPDLPATVGMYRPVLARILTDAAVAAGAKLRYATTVRSFSQDADGVDVTFSDGTTSRYDLVVGADGVRSQVRSLLGIELNTRPTGMGIWRVFTSRPASVTRTDLYYHGACYIAGYCPTADDSLYAYLVEDIQDRTRLTPDRQLEVMRELASHYHGPWDDIRDRMTDPGTINYTRFESHLLPPPWNRGRVVLIGDAVHTCPPTVAQGAAMALEDAVVLADVLLAADVLDQGAFDAFTTRRYDRAKTVVDASVQLGQWMLDSVEGDVPGLMGTIFALVSQPA